MTWQGSRKNQSESLMTALNTTALTADRPRDLGRGRGGMVFPDPIEYAASYTLLHNQQYQISHAAWPASSSNKPLICYVIEVKQPSSTLSKHAAEPLSCVSKANRGRHFGKITFPVAMCRSWTISYFINFSFYWHKESKFVFPEWLVHFEVCLAC